MEFETFFGEKSRSWYVKFKQRPAQLSMNLGLQQTLFAHQGHAVSIKKIQTGSEFLYMLGGVWQQHVLVVAPQFT